ncbi:MAG: hypothetical protein FWD31_05750 [Planctomycetaceae bacterium]|nr:hypothetical protein [Planctomycetaceae bacterium]
MFMLPANAKQHLNCYLVIVTPEMAKQWLLKNNFNRPLKPKLVENYVRQIESGNWRRTHQGIAFDDEGVVLDGQHRLHAIIRTGQSLPMLIFLNENQAAHEAIDGGKQRTLLDVVRLELLDDTIKEKHICVLKEMWAGRYCKNQNHLSATEVVNLYRRYYQAVRFAVDIFDSTIKNSTTLMAVIARAFHTVPKEKLLEFCSIIQTGNGDHPSTIVVLEFRHWFFKLRDRQEATRREIYKRASNALKAFIHNETTCELVRDSKELYPLHAVRQE